jgi:putative DNA primase/helicase
VTAADVARALGDARREGRRWRCRCPLHGGRSLVLSDGDRSLLLATCWGGCDRQDVLAELRRLGLIEGRGASHPPRLTKPLRPAGAARTTDRTARALAIWREAQAAEGSPLQGYLASRGIMLVGLCPEARASLRFHPRCRHPSGVALPAVIGLVEHVEHGPTAVHLTFLRADGGGKASLETPKVMYGPVGGGSVRLGVARPGEWLVVTEGIETAAAVATACSMPAWAALSAGGIKKLVLPREATHVIIAADHDASGTGQRAAQDAARRWLAEDRRVRIAMSPEPGEDMADVLLADDSGEAHHVA